MEEATLKPRPLKFPVWSLVHYPHPASHRGGERVCWELGCGELHPVFPNSLKLRTELGKCASFALFQGSHQLQGRCTSHSTPTSFLCAPPCYSLLPVRLCVCVSVYGICAPCGLQSVLYMLMVRCQESLTPDRSNFAAGWLLSHHPAFSDQGSRTIFPFCQKLIQNWPPSWGNRHLLLARVWIRIASREGNLDYLAI